MDPMDRIRGYYYGPPSPFAGDMARRSPAPLPSGNYINVVPMPVGVQYQRRKYSPQVPLPEYQ